mgnify:FL=1
MNIPYVIQESSAGITRYGIADAMLANRQIDCTGEITTERANALILQLRYLQQENPKEAIVMYINSLGGEVSAGLALYDVMQAVSCPVHTICVGTAASMGAVLFLSGDHREIFPHAKVMIHDPLIPEGVGGSALRVENISRELMKTREVIGSIIGKHTGKSMDEVYAVMAKDTYFDAAQALEFGLADAIIERM